MAFQATFYTPQWDTEESTDRDPTGNGEPAHISHYVSPHSWADQRTPSSASIALARLLNVNGSRLGSFGLARCASSESSLGGSACPRRSNELQPAGSTST